MRRAILTLLAVILPALGWAQAEDAGAAPPPRPVISEIVSADPAAQRSFPGVVQGENVITLAFQTSGRLATLEVEAGDAVTEGEVLATLDGITLQEDLTAARAALDAARAEERLTRRQLDRTRQLVETGVSTEAALERIAAQHDAALARVESAQADLDRAEDAADYGTLRAPRDGIVLATMAKPGTAVSPGTGILQIVDESGREAVIDVPAGFARLLPAEATFEVRHHSASVPPVAARLRLVEPVTETSLDTRRLRLKLLDPPPDFRIGSLVSAVYTAQDAPLITVPRRALAQRDGETGVWRVGDDRRVRFVPVDPGPEMDDRVIVSSGVAPGDEIVIRGANSLSDGQQVGGRWQ